MTELKLITKNLLASLTELAKEADTIYWVTAFVMSSGVRKVLPALQEAAKNGAEIKLLAGDYLSITQPDALQLLADELPEAEIRLMQSGGTSFHPKAYLFKSGGRAAVIVGSSNLSAAALTNAVEWNLLASETREPLLFEEATEQFFDLFLAPSTVACDSVQIELYREQYEKTKRDLPFTAVFTEDDETEIMLGPSPQTQTAEPGESYAGEVLTPRPAQQIALENLREMEEKGHTKAMAVLATGLGKTYLAAFFADGRRTLFIAHRKELLAQAEQSFRLVHPAKTTGIYNARTKDKDCDFVFASIQTLARKERLHAFSPDEFDMIVIDEFHHAAAATYARVLDYFKPKFLLGLTATPDRLDNKDVYSLCDGNVAASIHFLQAIRQQWLAPFVYYGVYDEPDYSQIRWRSGKYNTEDLLEIQLREDYAEAVLHAWIEHKQTKTIAFCSSVKQAQYISSYFQKAGWRSFALHGATLSSEREIGRQMLERGEADIIFTVDLFNEGVDIPPVDTLLFIRPTESLTVFTQQIGRGLRIAKGKSHCTIIDLVGNYRSARKKYEVFNDSGTAISAITNETFTEPGNFEFYFDTQLINLLEAMKPQLPVRERFKEAYFEVKNDIGRRPSYLEFYLKANEDAGRVKELFGTYFSMLDEMNELDAIEKEALAIHKNWLEEAEKTLMTKSYKMVLLRCMLKRGANEWFKPVQAGDIWSCFQHYLTAKPYRMEKDLSDSSRKHFVENKKTPIVRLIKNMPMSKWINTTNDIAGWTEDGTFYFDLAIEEKHREMMYRWTKEICEYRLTSYFKSN